MPPQLRSHGRSSPPQPRDELISRLQEHTGVSLSVVEALKSLIVASYYSSLPDHLGGLFGPQEKYYRGNGKEPTFQDVPLAWVAKSVTFHIKSKVAAERRTEVYHAVLDGMPGHKSIPEWEEELPNPNAEPLTPFSKPRDGRTNQDIINAFAQAAGFDAKQASNISGQITCWDGLAGGSSSFMTVVDGVFTVESGRLKRRHTLEDVPVNYFRDRLMDYIAEDIEEEEKREASRKATCPDLTDDEIEEYARLIAEDREETERKDREEYDERVAKARKNPGNAAARNLALMQTALEEVDSDIDLEPAPSGSIGLYRDGERPKRISQSVVIPGFPPMAGEHVPYAYDLFVDRDCDQIRAMIKIFVTEGQWTLEQFRDALGSVSRQQLTKFLKKTGTTHDQKRSSAYLVAWDFFNKREFLGLSLSGASIMEDADATRERHERVLLEWQRDQQELDEQLQAEKSQQRKKKRKAEDGKAQDGKKKKARGRPALREIVNEAE